ncbi:AaceriAER351Wp [[Ashbya] aceris (nom. inval.)]|nr:AaceriAER351Wp [[Ashbya] aceris (nom. inval.)]
MGQVKEIIFLKNKTVPEDHYESIFQSNGFKTHFVPLITHEHLPDESLSKVCDKDYMEKLNCLVVTSQRTVECLYEDVLPYLPCEARASLLNKPVFVVGPATQEFMERCGFTDVRGGEETGNGALLAEFMLGMIQKGELNSSGTFLLLVGEIRRDIIKKRLQSANLEVEEVITYRTSPLHDISDRFQQVLTKHAWVVLFSPQGTAELLPLLRDEATKIAAIGPTTAQYLLDNDTPPALTSPKPEPVSLCNAVKAYLATSPTMDE